MSRAAPLTQEDVVCEIIKAIFERSKSVDRNEDTFCTNEISVTFNFCE